MKPNDRPWARATNMRHQTLACKGLSRPTVSARRMRSTFAAQARVHEAVEKVTGGATGILGCNRTKVKCARAR